MNAGELFSKLARLGIRLKAEGDRLRFAPRSAVTPDLADRMKAHKAELLAMLRPVSDVALAPPVVTRDAPAKPACRCGSTAWHDAPIHCGKSVRRDCRSCGRFIEFPVWYGKPSTNTRNVGWLDSLDLPAVRRDGGLSARGERK
jgi:hypothetical protein